MGDTQDPRTWLYPPQSRGKVTCLHIGLVGMTQAKGRDGEGRLSAWMPGKAPGCLSACVCLYTHRHMRYTCRDACAHIHTCPLMHAYIYMPSKAHTHTCTLCWCLVSGQWLRGVDGVTGPQHEQPLTPFSYTRMESLAPALCRVGVRLGMCCRG